MIPEADTIQAPAWTRRDRIILGLLVLLGLGARAAVIGAGGVRLDDPDGYLRIARTLAHEGGLLIDGRPTAYRPPLYPLMLAPLVRACDGPGLPAALALLHLALGGLTVALTADLVRRLGCGRGPAWVAAAVAAFDPVLVVQSRSVMTETPAACLVAATLWLLTLRGWLGAIGGGVGFGLAALCRPSLLPAAALTALVGLALGPGDLAARLRRSALLLAATLATASPWALRNLREFGEPIWTTTHGGYTLALANNAEYYADVLDGPPGAVWSGPNQASWIDSISDATRGMPEPEGDRALHRRAVAFIRSRPRDFARASLARLGRFWGVTPAAAVYPGPLRWATAAWTAPLWALCLVGAAHPAFRRWPGVAAPAFAMTLTAIHSAYWTDLRMRAPLVPAIAAIAAAGGAILARVAAGDLAQKSRNFSVFVLGKFRRLD